MQPIEIAIASWNVVGDGRQFKELPEDFRFRLLDVAKEIVSGKSADIVGLELFESKAREIIENPPKPVNGSLLPYAELIAKAAGMGHIAQIGQSILQVPAFAESVYKAAAKNTHPDKGGTENGFQTLEQAMAIVRRSHGGTK